MKSSWLKFALFYLVVIAFLGTLLRFQFISPVSGINYKFLLHAHSHVALLGWLYSAFFIALIFAFLRQEDQQKKTYKIQFWLSQFAVLGMLFSFPFQGYAAISITFSTAHIFMNYWFIFQFLADAKKNVVNGTQHYLSYKLVKWALFFMALSTLGPWSLGPIMAKGFSGSHLYYLAIYFYLHFQYNGWFTMAVFGLLFWWMENYAISYSKSKGNLFYRLITFACLPSYALSALWTKPDVWVYFIGGIAAVGQLIALIFIVKIISAQWASIKSHFNPFIRTILSLSALAFFLKIVLQFTSAFPAMAELAYQIRNFVIGYLHLTLLGFVTLFVFAFYSQIGWIDLEKSLAKTGFIAFLTGFLTSEILIFLEGLAAWIQQKTIPYYFEMLFGVSLLMAIGLMLFWVSQLKGPVVKKT